MSCRLLSVRPSHKPLFHCIFSLHIYRWTLCLQYRDDSTGVESEWGTLEIGKAIFSYGVTTDKRGHLFVTDYNNECIQTFSASDGQYLGLLMKGSEAIGDIFSVKCSTESSSLVVACYFQGNQC